jgi:hypothetical protein
VSDGAEREAAVLARCSKYAAQYVTQLRGHALYVEVLDRLEAAGGTLFELDVEHAFYESLRAERRKSEGQGNAGPDSLTKVLENVCF